MDTVKQTKTDETKKTQVTNDNLWMNNHEFLQVTWIFAGNLYYNSAWHTIPENLSETKGKKEFFPSQSWCFSCVCVWAYRGFIVRHAIKT